MKRNSLLSQFFKDKYASIAMIVLLVLYAAILFADFLAPYSKEFSDRHRAYVPPSKIFTIDENGKFSRPYTYNYQRYFDAQELKISYVTVEPQGRLFLLGTDINGRDVFSRILFGGRISLTIGFLALFISFPLGMLYGGISGYLGGAADNIMMRVSEAIMSIPSFYLLIILAAILPTNMTSIQRFTLIVVILALIGWAGFSRVVRGMVLSVKNQEFVQAAESIGASKLRIIIKHLLPQTLSYVIVAMTLSVPSYILSESGLSFLGLGIQQPDASWGNMLKEAQEYVNILYRPWLLTPGFLIFIAVLSFNLIGDTIRDILDPKSKLR